MSEEKIIILSHESDIDGLGNIILGKIAFKNIEYELFENPRDLELKFRRYIENEELYQYDKMFITDLSLYPPSIEMVNRDEIIKEKLIIFDHHKGAIDAGCSQYEFSNVVIKDENEIKMCGTRLFYDYLCRNNFLKRSVLLDDFVELTRLEDTWEWGKNGKFGVMAHDLAILFNSITREEYIERILNKMNDFNEHFKFNKEEIQIIQMKKEEYNTSINEAINEIEYFKDELGNDFGIVFAKYQLRNDIPEHIRHIGNPEKIKYIIIVAMDKGENGQKSYRLIEDGFDVNEIAKLHGGGGHIAAAAVPISSDQKSKALSLPKKEALDYLAKCGA